MMNISECFLAYGDSRSNTIKVVHCLLYGKSPEQHDPTTRIKLKAFEKLPDRDAYYNQYFYVPVEAFERIQTISIVSLLEERMLYEPQLIHTPIPLCVVAADRPNSILNGLIRELKILLHTQCGSMPLVVNQHIPAQHMPVELQDAVS